MDPGLSRIWTKAFWLLPSERQRGYPNTCVHNADHLRVKFCTTSPFGTRQKKNCLGKYKALHVCGLFFAEKNHKNDFDSNSTALQEKGQCWSTMSATSLQKHENAAYYMFLHSDSRIFRESFDNIVVQYVIIKSVWTAAMNFNDVDHLCVKFSTTPPFGNRRKRNCSQPPCGKVTKPSTHVVF